MPDSIIQKIVKEQDLTLGESVSIFSNMLSGNTAPADISDILVALARKGESSSEIAGAAISMRAKSLQIHPNVPNLTDVCGTGGDNLHSFNISTTVAFVLAGGGVPVAKHGNRSVSSSSGSADVLEKLGISLDISTSKVQQAIEQIGIGFLFAPAFHPGMKYVMPVRKQLGIRTIFNIVGPLTNPAGAQYQVIGVFRKNLCETMAEALREMRVTNALIVHGEDGMDEITLTGTTLYAHLHNGNIRIGKIDPEQLGFRLCNPKNLLGGNPADNARILLDILEKKDTGPRRDIVILNSGAAFWISGKVKNLKEAIELARHSIDSGAALQKLQELQDFSNN